MGIIIPEWPSIGKSIGGLRYFQTNPYINIYCQCYAPSLLKRSKKNIVLYNLHGSWACQIRCGALLYVVNAGLTEIGDWKSWLALDPSTNHMTMEPVEPVPWEAPNTVDDNGPMACDQQLVTSLWVKVTCLLIQWNNCCKLQYLLTAWFCCHRIIIHFPYIIPQLFQRRLQLDFCVVPNLFGAQRLHKGENHCFTAPPSHSNVNT